MNAQTKVEPSIVGALAKALPELEAAKKTKNNPAFKSKYADLGAVIDALEPLRQHGIWFRQVQHDNEGGVLIETLYIHESGQELSAGHTFVPAIKKDAQGYGSAMSYARRYGLQSAFGLATEDDDGNAASKAVADRGRSQEGAVGPGQRTSGGTAEPSGQVQNGEAATGRRKPEPLTGPIKTRAEARTRYGEIVRELRSCGDEDMLDAYLGTIKAELDQFQRELRSAWLGDGADFIGLKAEIDNARKDLTSDEWKRNPLIAG